VDRELELTATTDCAPGRRLAPDHDGKNAAAFDRPTSRHVVRPLTDGRRAITCSSRAAACTGLLLAD
jgi:hypothetical protein